MNKVLVIAPHPDDETLGCGGSLLNHAFIGDQVFWLIVTGMSDQYGWKKDQISRRDQEIKKVSSKYKFLKVFNLKHPTTKLKEISEKILIDEFSSIVKKIRPTIVYVPYKFDVHSDHRVTFNVFHSCTKWFRYPSIRKLLMYETLSETHINHIKSEVFNPNVFINISSYLDKKIEIMNIYKSEIGKIPFPRSKEIITSLAMFRGSQSGFKYAEAFELVFDR